MQGKTTKLAMLGLHPTIHLNGADLFELEEDQNRSGAYQKATVTIAYKPNKRACAAWEWAYNSGPGVYGCFWQRKLFYIGTYAGKDADLKVGNVARERWCKHVEGMTFRSCRIGIAPSRLRLIVSRHPNSLLATLLGRGNHAKLTKKGGNGNQVQYNKFLFADSYWAEYFSKLNQSMMKEFDFIYVRPDLSKVFLDMRKQQIDPHLRAVENSAIKQLFPLCNGANRKCTNGEATIQETSCAIEKLMMAQVEGFLSNNFQYQLKPRKYRCNKFMKT